jgi:hypothetical protein
MATPLMIIHRASGTSNASIGSHMSVVIEESCEPQGKANHQQGGRDDACPGQRNGDHSAAQMQMR